MKIAYDGNKILTFYQETKEQLAKGMATPRMALLYPTRACNQDCYYCSDGATNIEMRHKMMDAAMFLSIPKQVRELGCESIEMCGGGEPFLHPRMKDFIDEAVLQGLKLGALTNGTMLKGELADRVVDEFSYVRISMDSFTPETYSRIRRVPLDGPLSLVQVIENIKYMVKRKRETQSKMLLTVKAVFDVDMLDELPRFVDEAMALEVDGINIRATRNVGEKEIDSDPRVEKYTAYLQELMKRNGEPGRSHVFGFLKNTTLDVPVCFACNFHVFIDTDGALRICCYYQNRPEEHTFGSLRDGDLHSQWWGDEHKKKVAAIKPHQCNNYNCKYHRYNNLLYPAVVEDEGQYQFT